MVGVGATSLLSATRNQTVDLLAFIDQYSNRK